jgi:hypothetical protein
MGGRSLAAGLAFVVATQIGDAVKTVRAVTQGSGP